MKRGNSTMRVFCTQNLLWKSQENSLRYDDVNLRRTRRCWSAGQCAMRVFHHTNVGNNYGGKDLRATVFCIRSLSLLAAMHFPPAKWPPQQQHRDVLLLLTAGWEVTKKTRRKSKNQHGLCPPSIPLWFRGEDTRPIKLSHSALPRKIINKIFCTRRRHLLFYIIRDSNC